MTMNFKSAADFKKSLEARLKNISIGDNLQRLRRKVAFDRLLARVFASEEQKFFLKGGYAMELRLNTARATKDIDLTTLKRAEDGDNELLRNSILEDLRLLAKRDLGDFFVFQIGEAQIDLENAPYGGARFPVISLLDGKTFVQFQLDVGADAIVTRPETMQGADWLGYCGIPSPTFTMISIEQQFAEKLHAYTLPRQRPNTRVKDLIDLVLLTKMRSLELGTLREAVKLVFKIRETHPRPQQLDPPPQSWNEPYKELANECSLTLSLNDTYEEVFAIYSQLYQEDIAASKI